MFPQAAVYNSLLFDLLVGSIFGKRRWFWVVVWGLPAPLPHLTPRSADCFRALSEQLWWRYLRSAAMIKLLIFRHRLLTRNYRLAASVRIIKPPRPAATRNAATCDSRPPETGQLTDATIGWLNSWWWTAHSQRETSPKSTTLPSINQSDGIVKTRKLQRRLKTKRITN